MNSHKIGALWYCPCYSIILYNVALALTLYCLRITVCYWKEKSPGEYGADKFPVFVQHPAIGKHSIYGLPSEEYPGDIILSYTCIM
jgi:sarcosine oxidase/L-pipecolate oxidase